EVVPTFVGGTTITNVTLHNASEIARKDLRVGDEVVIRRAGEVIPEIIGHFGEHPEDSTPFAMPTVCPSCGDELDRTQVDWRCPNPACGLLRSLLYFFEREKMDVEGLGEAVIAQLIDRGLVS